MGYQVPINAGGTAAPPAPSVFGSSRTVPLLAGDQGTEQAVSYIIPDVLTYRADPVIRALAGQIVAPENPSDDVSQARALFEWVRDNIRFVKDPNGHELVQSPRWTLTFGFGDCDCITSLLATMAESVGLPARLVTVDLKGTGTFDHIYPEVFAGGQWIPMDRARPHPEFGVTNPQQFRRQVWEISDQNGAPLSGQTAGGKLYRMGCACAGAPGAGLATPYGTVFRQAAPLNGALQSLGQDGGDTYYDPTTDTTYTLDSSGQMVTYGGLPDTPTYYDANTGALIQNPGYLPGGMSTAQIAQLINAGGTAAQNILRAINTPTSPYYNPSSPYYNPTRYGPTASGSFLGIAGLSPAMAIGALLLVLLLAKR